MYDIPLSNLVAFITDNVQGSLKAVLFNTIHITCTAQLLNHTDGAWQMSFRAVNHDKIFKFAGFVAIAGKLVSSRLWFLSFDRFRFMKKIMISILMSIFL